MIARGAGWPALPLANNVESQGEQAGARGRQSWPPPAARPRPQLREPVLADLDSER